MCSGKEEFPFLNWNGAAFLVGWRAQRWETCLFAPKRSEWNESRLVLLAAGAVHTVPPLIDCTLAELWGSAAQNLACLAGFLVLIGAEAPHSHEYQKW